MPRMLRALAQRPEPGLLSVEYAITPRGPLTIQHWRSTEQLEAFAKNAALPHHPAWCAFNKVVGGNGDVGIWHETYLVSAGRYEVLYGNMPPFGPARAGEHVPVARKGETAAARRGASTT